MPVPSTSSDLDAMLEEVLTRSSPALQLAVPFDSSVLGPAEAPFPSSSSAFPGYPDPKYAAGFEGYDSIRGACDDDEDDDSDVFDVLAAPANVFVMQTPATSAPVAPNVDFATCPPAFTLAAAPESDFAPAASFTLFAAVPAVTAPVVPALMPAAPAARDRQALDQALRNIASIQPIVPVAASQPDSITRRPLSLAQLEGLNWMAQMEQTQFRGGFIDADKMQLLAYIIADRSPEQAKPNLVISNVQGRDAWAVAVQEFRDNYLDQAISQTFRTVPWEANGARSGGRSQADTLRHFDLVIVSYQTLKSQYQRERRPNDPRESPLHSIDWHRVIFDEGDFLKEGDNPTAQACYPIRATYRWCLTAKHPLDYEANFPTIIQFLRIEPLASHFCAECDCRASIDDFGGRSCNACQHAMCRHFSMVNYIWARKNPTGPGLIGTLMNRLMLRRRVRSDVDPPVVQREWLAEAHVDFAGSIMAQLP